MRKGEAVAGKQFFDLLYADGDFCKELGRAVLAGGRLETELKLYLTANSVARNTKRATLGQLIELVKKRDLLKQMQPHLELLRDQRNYLAHSVYPLFLGFIEETILPRSDLLDSDVDSFTERAWQLCENLNALADIVAKENLTHNKSLQPTADRDG